MAIKAYFSNQTNAPVLSGTLGSLIAVLDACLVNGFNQVSVSSITRTGSTVTVITSAAHGYEDPNLNYWVQNGVVNWATIAGATQPEYNGDWPVTYVNPTTFQFDIGTATPASPATGTIVTRRAAGGFAKPFVDSTGNLAAYRSNDITSRRHYWYVADDGTCPNSQGARYAGCRGYESMTGIASGSFPFPTITAAGNFGQYIAKSSTLDSVARHWSLYTDGKTVILTMHPDQAAGSPGAISLYSYAIGFGDLLSPVPDAYGTFVSALPSSSTSYSMAVNAGITCVSGGTNVTPNAGAGWTTVARKFNGAASPVFAAGQLGLGLPQNIAMGVTSYYTFPDYMSNRLVMAQAQMYEPTSAGAILRGMLPFYESGHGVVHQNREIITNVIGREGRKFQYIRTGAANMSYVGGVYIDLTGDSNGKWS